MIFPSYIFLLVFFPTVLLGWNLLGNLRLRLIFLTLASYVFYGWWDYRFTLLMLGSTLLDYVCGKQIDLNETPKLRKRWLTVSIAGNLTALGFFKYFNFFSDSFTALFSQFGISLDSPTLQVILPIGISFYTFQSMSYTIDIYKRQCKPTADFFSFAAYVSMFPQLVAGPIVRYADVEQQLASLPHRRVSSNQIVDGIHLFTIGILKKIWIADTIAVVSDRVFDSTSSVQFVACWAATLCYTFQLYFDFSAYSDMARGLGRILGFEFPVNFNSPYKSASISEFWSRWHISLSQWLRDYLYIPLGGSRNGLRKTLRNLLITMFLGGLWHGAAWNFVFWGLYHGLLLMVNAAFRKITTIRIPRIFSVPLTFLVVIIGWVLFRAPTLGRAKEIFEGMIGLNGIENSGLVRLFTMDFPGLPPQYQSVFGVGFLAVTTLIAFFAPNSDQLPKSRHMLSGIILALAMLATLSGLMKETPFLYFQF